MISSDSHVLVQGERRKESLLKIKTQSLDSLIKKENRAECNKAKDSIIEALAMIKDFGASMKEGVAYRGSFSDNGDLMFAPSKVDLLPPVEEINLLLKAADQRN